MPHVARFSVPHVDVRTLISATPEFYEYPCCDRDPLPYWTWGRVTLLGDAAHPMYPVGSNGASQAILDARALADSLAHAEHPRQALLAYEQKRLPMTAEIVRSNRRGGPEGVIDAVEQLAPDGFTDIEKVLSYAQREAIVRGYASKAGFAAPSLAAAVAGVAHTHVVARMGEPIRTIAIEAADALAASASRDDLTPPEAAAGSGRCARPPAPPRRPASVPSNCECSRTDRRAGGSARPRTAPSPCGRIC